MIFIMTNSIMLAFVDYEHPKSQHNRMIERVGNFFTVIFFIESIFKIIAMGFWGGKNSYLHDGFNIMDFVIAISG